MPTTKRRLRPVNLVRPRSTDRTDKGGRMSNNNKSLIVFAWGMEIVGVAGGLINSSYTTFGEKLPETFLGFLPAIPMLALPRSVTPPILAASVRLAPS